MRILLIATVICVILFLFDIELFLVSAIVLNAVGQGSGELNVSYNCDERTPGHLNLSL